MPKQRRLGGSQPDQTRHASQQQQHRPDVISRSSPLAIAELIQMVGRYLDRHALTMCLRVCHQWHQVLRYRVWEVIEKHLKRRLPRDPTKSNGPSLLHLSKHADLVRQLFLRLHKGHYSFPGRRPIYCRWLTELTVIARDCYKLDHIKRLLEENLAPFIVEHQATLKKLVLGVKQGKALTEAMVACSNLETLMTDVPFLKERKGFLEEAELQEIWMRWYELQGSRLQELTLTWDNPYGLNTDFTMNKTMDALLSRSSTSSLRNLDLRTRKTSLLSVQCQMLLVMKSPGLKRLSWSSCYFNNVAIFLFARAFEKSTHGPFCQQLESLSLPHHGDFVMKDFQRVMESLPALRDLELSEYDRMCVDIPSYLTTLSRLRRLSIAECRWATPDVVQDILCSMPYLEVLEADCLSDRAIKKDPRPWACTGLRELTVLILVLPFSGSTVQVRMMDRLCQLERLEILKIPKAVKFPVLDTLRERLRFMMESGLDRLKTLKRLQVFEAPMGPRWGKDEARWALENWTELRELNTDVDMEAKEILGHCLMENVLEDESFEF